MSKISNKNFVLDIYPRAYCFKCTHGWYKNQYLVLQKQQTVLESPTLLGQSYNPNRAWYMAKQKIKEEQEQKELIKRVDKIKEEFKQKILFILKKYDVDLEEEINYSHGGYASLMLENLEKVTEDEECPYQIIAYDVLVGPMGGGFDGIELHWSLPELIGMCILYKKKDFFNQD